jgi:arsenate reductase
MLTIYHNPSCRKSRAGLQYLKESGKPFTVVEYLKKPLDVKKLENLLVKLNLRPAEVLRTQEDYYKQHIRGKKFEDHELIRIIVENPRILQRPIVEGAYKAVIGDPAGNIETLGTPPPGPPLQGEGLGERS